VERSARPILSQYEVERVCNLDNVAKWPKLDENMSPKDKDKTGEGRGGIEQETERGGRQGEGQQPKAVVEAVRGGARESAGLAAGRRRFRNIMHTVPWLPRATDVSAGVRFARA